jgi:4-amino-4-deoxy-L-arabinose transferase-like glycosyltransferase
MIKKFINNLSVFLFIITFFYVTFQNSLVLEYSLLQLRNIDDLALLNSIVRLKNFIYEKNFPYIFSFIDYAYGNLFWIINSIFLVPLTLFNNDAIVIFLARQITVFFAFGCLYLIIKISQCFGACKTTANIIGLFFIFTPNFFEWSMRFHVNYYSVFFVLLSLLILLKSNERLFKNIIYSSIFFGFGVGIKLTGILLYPFLIYILVLSDDSKSQYLVQS